MMFLRRKFTFKAPKHYVKRKQSKKRYQVVFKSFWRLYNTLVVTGSRGIGKSMMLIAVYSRNVSMYSELQGK